MFYGKEVAEIVDNIPFQESSDIISFLESRGNHRLAYSVKVAFLNKMVNFLDNTLPGNAVKGVGNFVRSKTFDPGMDLARGAGKAVRNVGDSVGNVLWNVGQKGRVEEHEIDPDDPSGEYKGLAGKAKKKLKDYNKLNKGRRDYLKKDRQVVADRKEYFKGVRDQLRKLREGKLSPARIHAAVNRLRSLTSTVKEFRELGLASSIEGALIELEKEVLEKNWLFLDGLEMMFGDMDRTLTKSSRDKSFRNSPILRHLKTAATENPKEFAKVLLERANLFAESWKESASHLREAASELGSIKLSTDNILRENSISGASKVEVTADIQSVMDRLDDLKSLLGEVAKDGDSVLGRAQAIKEEVDRVYEEGGALKEGVDPGTTVKEFLDRFSGQPHIDNFVKAIGFVGLRKKLEGVSKRENLNDFVAGPGMSDPVFIEHFDYYKNNEYTGDIDVDLILAEVYGQKEEEIIFADAGTSKDSLEEAGKEFNDRAEENFKKRVKKSWKWTEWAGKLLGAEAEKIKDSNLPEGVEFVGIKIPEMKSPLSVYTLKYDASDAAGIGERFRDRIDGRYFKVTDRPLSTVPIKRFKITEVLSVGDDGRPSSPMKIELET